MRYGSSTKLFTKDSARDEKPRSQTRYAARRTLTSSEFSQLEDVPKWRIILLFAKEAVKNVPHCSLILQLLLKCLIQ